MEINPKIFMNHISLIPITVYITSYNRKEMLKRAVNSVIAQNYRPIELIIVDDASSEDTLTYLDSLDVAWFEENDIQLMIHRKKINSGACESRNIAIRTANGEFITGLDDDDEFLPNRLNDLVNAWDDRYAGICSSNIIIGDGNKTSVLAKGIGKISTNKLLERNVIGSQIFTKTEHLRAIGGFDPSFPAWQDYECWLRMSLNFGPILKINKPSYIVHTEHDKPRITRSDNTNKAISIFRQKHKHLLSNKQLRILNFKENEAKGVSYEKISNWLDALTLRTTPRVIKRWLKANL